MALTVNGKAYNLQLGGLLSVEQLAVNTTDLDGTPEVGTLTVKSDTNDGSTYPLVLRDSGDVNILTVNSDGLVSAASISVSGSATLNGSSVFANNITINDGLGFRFGSANDVLMSYSVAQTPDAMMVALGADSNGIVFCRRADGGYDFAHALQTNPTIWIQSGNQSATQWGSLSHDQTDFVLNQGSGATKLAGSFKNNTSTADGATYTSQNSDMVIYSTYTPTGTQDITLDDDHATDGRRIRIIDGGGNAGSNRIRVQRESTATINNATYLDIVTNYGHMDLIGIGGNWFAMQ